MRFWSRLQIGVATTLFCTRRGSTLWRWRGTPGRIRARGATPTVLRFAKDRSLDFPFVGVFRVEGGKISSIRIYYDQVEVFIQLGLMPGAAQA